MGLVRSSTPSPIEDVCQLTNARNMFLAASPYFQYRFASDSRLLSAYSPTLLTVSTATNLVSVLVLSYQQSKAHYPNRIILALILNTLAFALLALSTLLFRNISAAAYFGFLMSMVFAASLATGLAQNGIFAYVAAFNMPKYTQGIMVGQAIAGVLPCLAQIASVLAVPPGSTSLGEGKAVEPREGLPIPQESGTSAFAYFLTAVPISLLTLLAFSVLQRRHPDTGIISTPTVLANPTPVDPPPYDPSSPTLSTINTTSSNDDDEDNDIVTPPRKSVSILTIYKKLHWLANAVLLTFTLTMFYPVFTQKIHSASNPTSRLLQPSCFIPLAFLFWNIGDLIGRTLTLSRSLAKLTLYPKITLLLAISRVFWLPLYDLCAKGVIRSNFFYLVIVQCGFGIGSGVLGSLCMMGFAPYVEPSEREAAGGFMGLMLVGGLSVGSLASFLVM